MSHQPQEGSLIHLAKDDEHMGLWILFQLPHIGVEKCHEIGATLQVRDDTGGCREGRDVLG
jgi:hypothetical protein